MNEKANRLENRLEDERTIVDAWIEATGAPDPITWKSRNADRQGELKKLRYLLSTYRGMTRDLHNGPEDCPTYYDGCHCLAARVEELLELARHHRKNRDARDLRLDDLRAVLEENRHNNHRAVVGAVMDFLAEEVGLCSDCPFFRREDSECGAESNPHHGEDRGDMPQCYERTGAVRADQRG